MTMTAQNTFDFLLPDIGEGVVEGELMAWLVKPGDEVAEDQPMFEVMTDKATVEIPSPRRGKILATFGKVGEIIKVGDVVVTIEMAPGQTAPIMHGHGGGATPKAETPSCASTQVAAALPESLPQPEIPMALPETLPEVSVAAASGRVLATPATRKLARDLGVDIQRVPGSGPVGRVTKGDVQAFAQGKPAAAPVVSGAIAVPVSSAQLEERIALRGLRKKISEKMVQSAFTAPHFTFMDELDATKLIAMRAESKKAAEKQGVKLTYLPFIMKAVVAALKKFPLLNASLDDATSEIVVKKYYNLGIAVAGENGLIVPVIKDVDKKSILQLAKEVAEVAERARVGRNHPEELKGGTFTISSVGSVGGLFATPIINHPEVGILAVMKIKERPVIRDGQIAIGQMMNLALSFDHRVVDGAVGAEFTNEVIRYLENPSNLMIEMA